MRFSYLQNNTNKKNSTNAANATAKYAFLSPALSDMKPMSTGESAPPRPVAASMSPETVPDLCGYRVTAIFIKKGDRGPYTNPMAPMITSAAAGPPVNLSAASNAAANIHAAGTIAYLLW